MADIFSNVFPVPGASSRPLVEAAVVGAPIRHAIGQLTVNDQSAGDRGFLFKIPSHALLVPGGQIDVPATTGATNLTIGSQNDPDAFKVAFSGVAASTTDILSALIAANMQRRLWEHLGFAADPATELDIFMFFTDGTTNTADRIYTADIQYKTD